jgi:hypothetical protein
MGHVHPSSLEQSCQGATYYKQHILASKNKTIPITRGNLEFKQCRHFFEPPTKRILPRMAKICRLPKDSRNTVINANIGDTTDTHSQVLPSYTTKALAFIDISKPSSIPLVSTEVLEGDFTLVPTPRETPNWLKRALLEEKQERSIWAVDTHTCQQKQQEQGLKTKLQTI